MSFSWSFSVPSRSPDCEVPFSPRATWRIKKHAFSLVQKNLWSITVESWVVLRQQSEKNRAAAAKPRRSTARFVNVDRQALQRQARRKTCGGTTLWHHPHLHFAHRLHRDATSRRGSDDASAHPVRSPVPASGRCSPSSWLRAQLIR